MLYLSRVPRALRMPAGARQIISLPVVMLTLLLGACAGGHQSVEEEPPVMTESEAPVYRLGPGDVVSINVWKNPELSVRVPVRPDGFISVPLVGDVRAGGRTPAEIVTDTEGKLAQFIRTPKVSVIVEDISSSVFKNRVRIVGGVSEPKSMSHREGMRIIDLVLEAGGLNEFSSPNAARLYRQVEGQTRVYPVYLGDILQDGVLDTNYLLAPGDVLTVPERRF